MSLRIRKICGLSFFVAAAVILAWAGTAGAVPNLVYDGSYVDMYLKTFPGGLSEEKVFLDAGEATTIYGHVGSQSDPRLVLFSSSETLKAASGFSTIYATDGRINQITITAPGNYFKDLIFSVNLAPNQNNDLVITAKDKSGGTDSYDDWTSEDEWVNGGNDILVLSTSGNMMVSVTLTSSVGIEGFGIDQLKQTQISGVSPVPEPCTMFLLGSGLIGVAAFRKRFGKA